MGEKQYTLSDLVDRTGFNKRLIRYYITEKLVPGAGDQRGPNAVYGETTLHRLEMIKVLKAQPIGPTDRAMTLAEIRHALDNQPQPDFTPKAQNISFFESRAPNVVEDDTDSSASMYLAKMMDVETNFDESELDQQKEMQSCFLKHSISDEGNTEAPPPLDEILQSLHSLLTELGSDTRFNNQDGERNSWRRITSPDVEIQVRTPDNLEARVRLNRMAIKLGHLLAQEE